MVGECGQAEEQRCCLHESRQTDCRYLFAPLIESVRISAGNAEHIQAPDSHLNEQDAATLDVLEEDLDHAVGKSDQTQKVEKSESHGLTRQSCLQDGCALPCKVEL